MRAKFSVVYHSDAMAKYGRVHRIKHVVVQLIS